MRNQKPGRNKRRHETAQERWGSAEKPQTITEELAGEIEQDDRALHDLFMSCRSWYPKFFYGFTVEDFRRWNDTRLRALIETPPEETYQVASRRIFEQGGQMLWHSELRESKPARWSEPHAQAVHQTQPCACNICASLQLEILN